MKIAVTTDHTGLTYGGLFNELKDCLTSLGHEYVDYGPQTLDMDDDYPDFMVPAARAVAGGECEAGIILGGSGQGEAMAANRVKGARCSVFYGPAVPKAAVDVEGNASEDPYEILKLTRQHNHSNMLSLAARFLSAEEMKQAVKVWLETPYSDADRHARRVQKLDESV
jgi:ribose 5-phosphate isomerase B